MASFLYPKGIRTFDYPRFAETLRDEILAQAHAAAVDAGIEVEHIAKPHIRKEDVVESARGGTMFLWNGCGEA